jgi:hypothetical protein
VRHQAPDHPQSNELAERLVQSFKAGVDKLRRVGHPLNAAVRHFIAAYRSTPHSTTGHSPAELLYGRRMRTLLDLMAPRHTKGEDASARQKHNFDKKTKEHDGF